MKSKLITRFIMVAMIVASLSFGAGNAFAIPGNAAGSTSVVSPYWQTDSAVYTFVGVSHTSLVGMNSEIGVVIHALQGDPGGETTFGTEQFTISDATTKRIFIVATNHATINSASVTGTDTVFITGTTTGVSGSLAFIPRATTPVTTTTATGLRNRDVTMLSYWGAIVVPSTSTGFAMEFIGDTHDSLFAMLTKEAVNAQGLKFVARAVGLN